MTDADKRYVGSMPIEIYAAITPPAIVANPVDSSKK